MSLIRIIIAAFVAMQLSFTALAEDAPPAVVKLVPDLQLLGANAVLISAVKAQNDLGMSLDAIKKRDTEWIATSGVDDFMHSIMDNAAAQELKKIEASKPYYTEIFLMDNQGANVAMTNKTSDYWQGDEAKFKESFMDGKGAVHVGKVKFDESAQAYLVQVSVPVMDGDKAIGAITVGINLDELDRVAGK